MSRGEKYYIEDGYIMQVEPPPGPRCTTVITLYQLPTPEEAFAMVEKSQEQEMKEGK